MVEDEESASFMGGGSRQTNHEGNIRRGMSRHCSSTTGCKEHEPKEAQNGRLIGESKQYNSIIEVVTNPTGNSSINSETEIYRLF